MSAAVMRLAATDSRPGLTASVSIRISRSSVVILGCAVMAVTGFGLGGYLKTPATSVAVSPADAPYSG